MKKTVLKFSLFVCSIAFLSNSFAQNIQINSTWYLQDPTASDFEQASGFSNFHFTAMANDEFLFEYEENGTEYSETSTWAQIDANNFKFSVTEDSYLFAQFCPGDTFFVTYQITGAMMNMINLSSNECAFVAAGLVGSNWLNSDALSSDVLESNEFSIYPNPATEFVTINSYNNEKITSVLFISTTGSLIEVKRTDNYTFDVSNLEKGFYFLQITDNTGVKRLPRPIIVR